MNIIIKIDNKYYQQTDDSDDFSENACDTCALNIGECTSIPKEICSGSGKHFNEIEIDPTEEIIRKVLQLSDEADKNFKEGCRFIIGVTIDEQIDNIKRQQTGLLLEERIKYIKDHWKDTFYLHHIRRGKGPITVKI